MKFTNNSSHCDQNYSETQSLSHFSYVMFGGKVMLVDLQGCAIASSQSQSQSQPQPYSTNCFVLTDPAFHTENKSAGDTDLGTTGFESFFENHTCNSICRAMGLERPLK
jgi:hypothetical protein